MKKISRASTTLEEALFHKRHELSQKDLDAAAVVTQEMAMEKMTSILITQSRKPEPEVNSY